MTHSFKSTLKAFRASQPFNVAATSTVRSISRLLGRDLEPAIKHLHRVGYTSARLPDGKTMRLWSRGDDWVPNQVYWRGWSGYEPETSPILYRLARSADVTVDVGAHIGFYSLLAAYANPRGQVFAFEPSPIVYERLQRNAAINKLPNLTIIQSAAASTAGEADLFHVEGARIQSSSGLAAGHFVKISPDRIASVRVPVVRLDEYLRDHGVARVDLVKVDTETTEVDVLDGMRETLRRDQPAIFCEVLPQGDVARLTELLSQYNYRYYHLTRTGPVARTEIIADADVRDLNYLFVARPEHCAEIDRLVAAAR